MVYKLYWVPAFLVYYNHNKLVGISLMSIDYIVKSKKLMVYRFFLV